MEEKDLQKLSNEEIIEEGKKYIPIYCLDNLEKLKDNKDSLIAIIETIKMLDKGYSFEEAYNTFSSLSKNKEDDVINLIECSNITQNFAKFVADKEDFSNKKEVFKSADKYKEDYISESAARKNYADVMPFYSNRFEKNNMLLIDDFAEYIVENKVNGKNGNVYYKIGGKEHEFSTVDDTVESIYKKVTGFTKEQGEKINHIEHFKKEKEKEEKIIEKANGIKFEDIGNLIEEPNSNRDIYLNELFKNFLKGEEIKNEYYEMASKKIADEDKEAILKISNDSESGLITKEEAMEQLDKVGKSSEHSYLGAKIDSQRIQESIEYFEDFKKNWARLDSIVIPEKKAELLENYKNIITGGFETTKTMSQAVDVMEKLASGMNKYELREYMENKYPIQAEYATSITNNYILKYMDKGPDFIESTYPNINEEFKMEIEKVKQENEIIYESRNKDIEEKLGYEVAENKPELSYEELGALIADPKDENEKFLNEQFKKMLNGEEIETIDFDSNDFKNITPQEYASKKHIYDSLELMKEFKENWPRFEKSIMPEKREEFLEHYKKIIADGFELPENVTQSVDVMEKLKSGMDNAQLRKYIEEKYPYQANDCNSSLLSDVLHYSENGPKFLEETFPNMTEEYKEAINKVELENEIIRKSEKINDLTAENDRLNNELEELKQQLIEAKARETLNVDVVEQEEKRDYNQNIGE